MSIDKKLVSILIPVYNREHLIIPCIESALAQTYKNIEIIIVDNNSTDGTWNICKEYAKNYAITFLTNAFAPATASSVWKDARLSSSRTEYRPMYSRSECLHSR